MDRATREYLAERYVPGATREQIRAAAASLAAAACELRAEGEAIEVLGPTFFVPSDEASLSRFRSSSADLVEVAHERAGVKLARVVETLPIPACPDTLEPSEVGT